MADFLDIFSSSSSEPRTPSPRASIDYPSPPGSMDSIMTTADFAVPPPPSSFFQHDWYAAHHSAPQAHFWPAATQSLSAAATAVPLPAGRGFLSDLYDSQVDDVKDHHHHHHGHGKHGLPDAAGMYLSPPGGIFRADWDLGGSVGGSSAESSPSVHNLATPSSASPAASAAEPSYYRRASYPYVRHDDAATAVYHSSSRNDGPIYAEPLPIDHHHNPQPLAADPAHLHARPLDDGAAQHHQPQHHHQHHQPTPPPQYVAGPPHGHHLSHHHHPDDAVKMESSPGMVPAHAYYRPPHQAPQPQAGPPQPQPMPSTTASYMTHPGGIPIMHTDDAASKETQYLRRRCFNCHTTEPPSWRRSTLNPGKIVCNKCGLYERTHLRPRPHRFDELRATSKARKAASKAAPPPQHHMMQQGIPQQVQHIPSPNLSPKSQQQGYVKKEPLDEYEMRRASVGSVGSGNINGGEWDQNVHRLSQSPPMAHTAAGPIRLPSLPGAPLGSRTPEAQRPYFERRTSLTMGLEGSPQRSDSPAQQHWQPTMSVADLVEDDKLQKPVN